MFNLQDSAFSESYSLHEAILSASTGAQSGGGAYAFASKTGVNLCFKDEALSKLTAGSKFKLIVGVDQITNSQALAALGDIAYINAEFDVMAYLNTSGRSIFHPKFMWFKKQRGGTLVVGSGNLTLNGLRHNCEAFVTLELDEAKMLGFLHKWDLWIGEVSSKLFPIDSTEIVEQAKRNHRANAAAASGGKHPEAPAIRKPGLESGMEQRAVSAGENVSEALTDEWMPADDQLVLAAEIPKASDRWNQANFDKDSFENYFGATVGDSSVRVLLRHIADDGSLGEIESRPSVSVRSQNYRFELGAAAGLAYPPEGAGRPIAVFVKLNTRTFLYTLCMPGTTHYDGLKNFCASQYEGRQDQMMRVRTTVDTIRSAVPQLPLW